MTSRLALGTVQFGLDYGISNVTGITTPEECAKILFVANCAGVDTIDTAINYGSSEQVLGGLGMAGWRTISKLPSLPEGCLDIYQWVQDQVNSSLNRLGLDRIYGFLLHNPSQVFDAFGPKILDALFLMQRDGIVEKIGVSIYSPEQLARIYSVFKPDIVQAPLNLVDRRLVDSGWLDRLASDGVEVHTRSAFLQGLLLMERPGAYFEPWRYLWSVWQNWLGENPTISPVAVCLAYPLSFPSISRVVVGVNCVNQLNELLAASSNAEGIRCFPKISSSDNRLINPVNWSVTQG
jgi:aryl-alcohol dehydrogenase-like predicted oxidoreductase